MSKSTGVGPENVAVELHSSIGVFGDVLPMKASRDGATVFNLNDSDYVHLEVDREGAPARTLSWQTVAMVQIGEVVGGGILTMAAAFAQLGWVMGVLFLFFFLPVNVYIGCVLSKCREICPAAMSYEDMSNYVIGKKWVTNSINFTIATYLLLTFGGYFLAITNSLQMLFFDVALCGPIFGAIVVGVMILPMQIRTLHGTTILVWANFVFICIAVFVALFFMMFNMSTHRALPDVGTTQVVADDITWISFLNAISKIMWAYMGCYVYLQMMSEMKKPGDFPKTFLISGPFQFLMYLFVAVVGYMYDGNKAGGIIIAAIDPHTYPALIRLSAFFLFLHLMIAYLILCILFCRDIHSKVHPKSLNDSGKTGKLIWFALTTTLLVLSYVISNGMPLFDKITALIGALQSPIIGYFVPPMLLLAARRRFKMKTGWFEFISLWSIMIFAVVIMFIGTAANIISFIDAMHEKHMTPFQCNMIALEENWSSM
uniref:Amino acid transporter transmembrane domain-containing protein n=1 Tax=Mucochytrium quahogii TaxID=96639 RepID=A0A7S2W8R5_9STRA|mmetsp:Transcript_5526/g.9858  ORF Transcript_5526/g.9858 Transcript_5526/m.9858 type:complete len:485 (+) Transcript_5526:65-1519(+)